MITNDDILKLEKAFATKHELAETKFELKEEIKENADRVLTAVDAVLKEVKDMRYEQAAHQIDHDRI